MSWLKENWLKVFLVIAISIFLLIQWGNFEVQKTKAILDTCVGTNKETVEQCVKLFLFPK